MIIVITKDAIDDSYIREEKSEPFQVLVHDAHGCPDLVLCSEYCLSTHCLAGICIGRQALDCTCLL